MLTSWSEVSTPAELSIASVLIRPPFSAYSMRPRCVTPRLAPSPTTLARKLVGVDAQRVIGAVAGLGMALVRRLDIGADAAEPEQIDVGASAVAGSARPASDASVGRCRRARSHLRATPRSIWRCARRSPPPFEISAGS